MLKFCPRCGSSVKETMRFCKNCGAALDDDDTREMLPKKPGLHPPDRSGQKRNYLLIAAIVGILLIASVGYLLLQNTLSIQSDPVGAGVYLNSEFRGVTPCVIRNLLPGEYHMEFRHDGYPSWQKNITVTPGETGTINADLSDNLIPAVKLHAFRVRPYKTARVQRVVYTN